MTELNLKILILIIFYWMKNHIKILIYDVLYKTFIDTKPLHIMFDKVDDFIRDYDETKYLNAFRTFCTKPRLVQNLCALCSIK